jgi:methyl-accepting chemotaxis protein
MASLKLSTKILAGGAAATLVFAGVLVLLHLRINDYAYTVKEEKVRSLVESAMGVVGDYGAQAERGALSRAEAQRAALAALKAMRYAGNNYFWVNDMQARMVMHPTNPMLDGKDLHDYKDPSGDAPFVRMVEVCRKAGGGPVRYMWPKPGSAEPEPKVSYVKLYAPWGWVVGTGIYVDDVEAELGEMARRAGLTLVLVGAVFALLSLALARSVARPVERIAADLAQASTEVEGASRRVRDSSAAISTGVDDQAAQTRKALDTLRLLAEEAQTSGETARETGALMKETTQAVEEGRRRIAHMTEAMSSMAEANHRLSEMAKTISGIAFQTNLLALNAAVEAARAGQAGVGFAVVADEVRNLAVRASKASQEAEEEIEESTRRSDEGRNAIEDVVKAFQTIDGRVRQGSECMEKIVSVMSRQRTHVGEVSAEAARLDEVARANAGSSREAAEAASRLETEAGELKTIVLPLLELVRGSAKN